MTKCPNCQAEIEVNIDTTICPACSQEIDLSNTLDPSFSRIGDSVDLPDAEDDASVSGSVDSDSADSASHIAEDDENASTKDVDADVAASVEIPFDMETALTALDDEKLADQGDDEHGSTELSVEVENRESTESAGYDYDHDQFVPTLTNEDEGDRQVGLDIPEREIVSKGQGKDSVDEFDYELKEEIGKGAVGIVYSATQASLDREVAIKMLAKQKMVGKKKEHITSLTERDIQKFLAEAQITARLDHPNIITVHDIGLTKNETLFYSMKLMKGEVWNKTLGTNSLDQNLEIFENMCDAIRYAHSQNVIHRDLKPQNVLVGEFGEVQVSDWGMALDLDQLNGAPISGGGTPSYMSPEMARHFLAQNRKKKLARRLESAKKSEHAELNRQLKALQDEETVHKKMINKSSDIYLLGAILFEIAVGYAPHRFQSLSKRSELGTRYSTYKSMKELERAASHTIARYKVPKQEDQQARDALKQVAIKAIAFNPDDRHLTVEGLVNDLKEFKNLIRSIDLTNEGRKQLERSEVQRDSYTNLASANFAYEEALNLWPENKNAKAGKAEAIFAYAKRAQTKMDYELGISLLTEDAIRMQPTETDAVSLKRDLETEKKKRDGRLRRLRIATTLAGIVIIAAMILSYFAWTKGQEVIAKNQELGLAQGKINEAKSLADEAGESAKAAVKKQEDAEKLAEDAVKQQDDAEKLAEDAVKKQEDAEELANDADKLRRDAVKKKEDAEKLAEGAVKKQKDAEKLAEDAVKQQEDAEKLAEDAVKKQEAAEELAAKVEEQAKTLQEEAKYTQYVTRLNKVEQFAVEPDQEAAKQALKSIFSDSKLPYELRDSWELHHLSGWADPSGDSFTGKKEDPEQFTSVQSSENGNVTIASTASQLYRLAAPTNEENNDRQLQVIPIEIDGLDSTSGITSLSVSSSGKYLAFLQSETSQSEANTPVICRIQSSGGNVRVQKLNFRNSADSENSVNEFANAIKFVGERIVFRGQHVQIFETDNGLDVFTVDQRVNRGDNHFRAALTNVKIDDAGTMEITNCQKAKIPGQIFVSNPGLLTQAKCLVSGDTDQSSRKFAYLSSYPDRQSKFGLVVVDFDKVVADYAGLGEVSKESAKIDARILKGLRDRSVSVELNPTSILLNGDEVFIGGNDGRIQRFSKVDSDWILDDSDKRENHNAPVRNIRVVEVNSQKRVYSSSDNEVCIWSDFVKADGTTSVKATKYFGNKGPIAGMTVIAASNRPMLLTLSSTRDEAQIRLWDANPSSTNHLAEWKPVSISNPNRPAEAGSTEIENRLGTSAGRKLVGGVIDQDPGAEERQTAAAYAYDDGSIEYWNSNSQTVRIANPAIEIDSSGTFGLFENRYVTHYSNKNGLLVWDIKDPINNYTPSQFHDPAIGFPSGKGAPVNPTTHFSANEDGNTLLTSHASQKDRIIVWSKSDGVYHPSVLGPFGARDAGGSTVEDGLPVDETTAQPVLLDDGILAIVLRFKYTFQVQVYPLDSMNEPLFVSEKISGVEFNRIVKDQSDFVVFYQDTRSRDSGFRGFRMVRNGTEWSRADFETPESLTQDYQRFELTDSRANNNATQFLAIGQKAKPKTGKDEESKDASKGRIIEQGKTKLIQWSSAGALKEVDVDSFTSRVLPQFVTTNRVAYISRDFAKDKSQTSQLKFVGEEDADMVINSPFTQDPAKRWARVGSSHAIYSGKNWFSLIDATGERLFAYTSENVASEMALNGNDLLVRRRDNSVEYVDLTSSPPTRHKIKNTYSRVSMSEYKTDTGMVALLGKDNQVELTTIDNLKANEDAFKKLEQANRDQARVIDFGWISGNAAQKLGNNQPELPRQLVTLAAFGESKLRLEFWNPNPDGPNVPLGTFSLEFDGDTKNISGFELAPFSANVLAIRSSTNADSQSTKGVAHYWVLNSDDEGNRNWAVVNAEDMDVYGLDIGEVEFNRGDDYATRIAVGGADSVKFFLVQKTVTEKLGPDGAKQPEIDFNLVEVYDSSSLADEFLLPVESVQFSGDGKKVTAASAESSRIWLGGNWDADKVAFEVDEN